MRTYLYIVSYLGRSRVGSPRAERLAVEATIICTSVIDEQGAKLNPHSQTKVQITDVLVHTVVCVRAKLSAKALVAACAPPRA